MALEKTSFSTFLLKDAAVAEVEEALFGNGIPLTEGRSEEHTSELQSPI